MMKYTILILVVAVAGASALPSSMRVRRSYAAVPVAAVPAVAHVPGYAAVPTLTAVHSQHLIPQPPAVHTVASPTTVLQTVQTGNAIVGHQKVGEQIVGKTPDVNGYAFKSEVRHDAPVYAPAAPVVALAAPLVGHAPLPVPVVAAPAAPLVAHPAAPASVSSYTVETGHTIAHDTVVTSPVIQNTLHAPVIGAAPVVAQVAVPAPVALPPAPLAYPAYKKA